MAMLLEFIVLLWLTALGLSVYFFVKSLNEAIQKGHELKAEKAEQAARAHWHYSIPVHHVLPTGHGRRHPAH
jgi:hypothetical protein